MPFDLSTAAPVGGFDLSTAEPVSFDNQTRLREELTALQKQPSVGRWIEPTEQLVQGFANMPATIFNLPSMAASALGFNVEPQPFSYYAEQLERRDIFRVVEPPAPAIENIVQPEKSNPPAVNVPNPMDLIRNLTLVGIVLDQYSTAIIEDQQSQETLFLHVGDQVNEMTVEQIQKSKVIFDFHGQRLELTQ